jgi:hypothetical protein
MSQKALFLTLCMGDYIIKAPTRIETNTSKSIRLFSNSKNISGRVFVIYEYIRIFRKSIRTLIRIFNIREYSNNRILFKKNIWEKIRFWVKIGYSITR